MLNFIMKTIFAILVFARALFLPGTDSVRLNDTLPMRSVVDVREFGAKGDGRTDDAAAIQAVVGEVKINRELSVGSRRAHGAEVG